MAFVVGTSFDSFAEFEIALAAHEKVVFANFVKQTKVTLVTNQRKEFSFADVTKFNVQRLYLRCKKGGTPQVKASVQHLRQTSSYRDQCPAKIKIAFDRIKEKLTVVAIKDEHNHVCSAKIFGTMPKQRRLVGEKKKYVEEALKLKANTRLVQHEVKKTFGDSITLRDIHNYKSKLNSNEMNTDDGSPLESIYAELTKSDGMIAEIIASEEGNELEGIYIQDERMRKYFSLYPELVIMDATYKVNDRRMPLFVVVIVDGNGETQIVALFILKSENYNTVTQMLNKFKEVNAKHDQIKVILSDKNFADRRAYSECFPQAQLQLCIFHVIQAWKRQIKTNTMEISATEKKDVLEIMQRMIYASTEQQYRGTKFSFGESLFRPKLARSGHTEAVGSVPYEQLPKLPESNHQQS